VPQIHLLAFWASWRGPGVPITVAQIRVDLRKMIGQVKAMIEADVNATLQCGQLHVLYGYLLQAQFYANQMSETAITLNATARHQAGYPTPGETIHGN
jgi:FlaG/FlaF family flagellin (archaellin)